MSTTFVASTQLTTIECGRCGGIYAIGETYRDKCHDDGTSWNCPYCRVGWGYAGNSRVEQLTRKLAFQERELAHETARHKWTKSNLKDTEHRRRGEKAAKTRLKNRAAAGVCPCCNRTFKQLAAHMKTKHPTWNKSKAEDTA